jgi:CheY-like chemotaxis protein
VKKILLADDSITIQKVVELTFSEGEYQVVCVGNGAQALRKVQEIKPDIVLLDVIMPEKNGYEVCEQIKRSPATSGIPVLLLTGTFEPFDKKRADQAGADGHLTKPFESQVLVSRVEELIAATPALASDEAGGAMDIVSGGEVYHVDPGAEAAMRLTAARPAAAPPPPPVPAPQTRPAAAAPATPPPAPDAGGAYVGFADVGFMQDRSDMIPEQFEIAGEAPTATVRLRRDAILSGAAPAAGAPDTIFSGAGESQFDMVGDDAGAPSIAPVPEPPPDWASPPEAPPAETWAAEPDPIAPAAPGPAAAAPMPLSPEAIELIAEKVVQRISDRVVREIAWEVIPQVAEAVVRDRIRELEEKPTD